jgi:hypothetical protein
MGPWPVLEKSNRRKRILAGRSGGTSTFSIQCPPSTTRRATVPTLKSYVILAFSNKPPSLPKNQMPAIRGNANMMEGVRIITLKFPHIIKIC